MKTANCLLWIIVLAVAGEVRGAKLPAPLFDGLGDHHHTISTRSKQAQQFFNQGLTLCYAFNHKEAIRSFRAAAQLDPQCAMAYWGIAYAYGPHVNKPMSKEENEQAWAAVLKAKELQSSATQKEQRYIEAISARYQAEWQEDRLALDKAYAAAMRKVAKEYPDDLDAWAILAEALMDTMPWDYWRKDRSPKPETEEAFAALRLVINRNPNHPGANHFYIHAVEAGPTPEQGIPSADRLLDYAPHAGHLVHMPSHIYVRLGDFEKAVLSNEKAIRADRAYIRSCAAQGFYPGVYYPHNLHFLWFANGLQGRSKDALSAANKVAQYAGEMRCAATPVVEAPRFRHLPWVTQLRFGKYDEVLRAEEPPGTNDFIIDRVMWHFARGMAYCAKGKGAEAQTEHASLIKVMNSDGAKKLDTPQFPASGIMAVADQLLAGKIAGVNGEKTKMIERLEKAVETEDALPYMEPPYWPYATRPALGAALLQNGNAAKAEEVFREDLKRLPRNGWGLLGLEESLRQQDKTESANLVQQEFRRAWQKADTKLRLEWF